MIFSEVAGNANRAGGLMQISGRPGCAALPRALERHEPGLSLGCAGIAHVQGIGANDLPAVVPGDQAEALECTSPPMRQVLSYYQQQG